MKPFKSLRWTATLSSFVLVVVVGVVGHAAPAQAYLDPGTGSMVLQLIMGGVAGAMVIGKLYWQRVKAVFGFSSSEASSEIEMAAEMKGKDLSTGSKTPETDVD